MAIDKAYRWRLLAERLQRRYSSSRYPAWRRGGGILNRIRSYHRKVRNILEEWARNVSLKIVGLSLRLGYAVARENLTGLIKALRKMPKDHRTKLIIMGYSRLGRWIDWQAMKHGAPIVIVDPRGTSSECPNCDSKLEENGYRRLRCPSCGFEADRDIVGKLNTRKRALEILGIKADFGELRTLQMTDVNPNRCGESMKRSEARGFDDDLRSPRPLRAGGGQLYYKN